MIKKNIAKEKDSVIAVIILLLLLSIFFKNMIWVYAAIAISVISILSSFVTHLLHTLWIGLTEFIGKINAWIILSVVFIFILIPISILKKWFGKQEIILKRGDLTTTFQLRNKTYSSDDFENPW